jgi:hypothetical protein
MSSFESPISNRKFQGQPMRDLEIPDESGPPGPPTGGGQFAPSVTRRYGPPPNEQEIEEFQQRMEATANPDLNLSEMEREMKRSREDKMKGQSRLNEGAKRRVDMLVGITRGTRTSEIEGNVYSFKTLKSKEMREVMVASAEFDGTIHFPFEMRRQLLARSITQVAGVETAQFVGSNTLEDRLSFIDDADDILLNRLYDEYLIMVKETRERYSIKSDAEAKEVIEDLKK